MAGTYKGKSVPDCFINPKGKLLAMWELSHPQCEHCSVEEYCKEAQDRLVDGEYTEDYFVPEVDEEDWGFSDTIPTTYTSLPHGVRRITPAKKPPAQTTTQAPIATKAQPIAPRGPRMNELQLAVPRTRQVLPYEGETLFERLGKNVVLGGVTSAAFETMLTFGSFEWKPKPAAPRPVETSDPDVNTLEGIKEIVERALKRKKDGT